MLATEETKTVWKDNSGQQWNTKDDAEYASIRRALRPATGGFEILPQLLVSVLKGNPEAKAWLLQQLGEQPIIPMEGNPTTAQEAMWIAVGEYMLELHGKPGSLFSQVKDAAAVYGILDFLRGLAKHIPSLQPAAQPQQEEIDIAQVLFKQWSQIPSAMANNIKKAGYKLVKA